MEFTKLLLFVSMFFFSVVMDERTLSSLISPILPLGSCSLLTLDSSRNSFWQLNLCSYELPVSLFPLGIYIKCYCIYLLKNKPKQKNKIIYKQSFHVVENILYIIIKLRCFLISIFCYIVIVFYTVGYSLENFTETWDLS